MACLAGCRFAFLGFATGLLPTVLRGDVLVLVTAETLVTVVAGVSMPRLRFLDEETLMPASSMSKLAPEAGEDRNEPSSLKSSLVSDDCSDSWRDTPLAENAWRDLAKERVCL